MDYFINIYMNILRFVVKILNNSGIAKKQGQKYNKYVSLSTLKVKNGITLVAHKIVFGFLKPFFVCLVNLYNFWRFLLYLHLYILL